jgi:aminobenzoyl-glutamate utilization protein B
MNVGVNYMREHMPSDARIHYAILDTGGVAPNVVQATAKVRYAVRARDIAEMNPLVERVKKVAEGAALMTETQVAMRIISAVSNLMANAPLEQAMHANLLRLGPPPFDAADRAFAEQIRATLSEQDIAAPYRRAGLPVRKDQPLADAIVPLGLRGEPLLGSTDVGDVSWTVPLVQADGATIAIGTPFHSWQLTAQGKSPLAKKGMVHVAKVMAATAVDAIGDPGLIARAKADLAARTRDMPYVCPIPAEVQPLIPKRAG